MDGDDAAAAMDEGLEGGALRLGEKFGGGIVLAGAVAEQDDRIARRADPRR